MENALKLEINSRTEIYCFDFKPTDFVIEQGSQSSTLNILWNVKQELRCKTIVVDGGYLVDILNQNNYQSTAKGIEVNILHVISHKKRLDQLCGNISNAYVNAYTNEKVYEFSGK